MHEVGRGQRAFEASPVQGTVAHLAGGDGRPEPSQPRAGTDGLVVLVEGVDREVLAPIAGSLAAIVCLDDDADHRVADASRALGVPCVVGVAFDGGAPADGTLVLVDCAREEDGLILVVDGGEADARPEDADGVPGAST